MSEDILERAKEAASIEYAPDISYDDWRGLVRELIAEVERLRGLMDVVENTSRLRGNRLEEQIEALVIQKSAKDTRIKVLDAEDERWKSAYHRERELCPLPDSDCSRVRDRDARIKELEAENKRLEAAFLTAKIAQIRYEEVFCEEDLPQMAREALEKIRRGEKDE